jgi:pyruvate kinase
MRTKIVCTLGPASDNARTLKKMMCANMVIARLNFSHGIHKDHEHRIEQIRTLNRECRKSVMILQDLAGYRIRIGKFRDKKPIALKKNQVVWLTNRNVPCTEDLISFDYTGPLADLKPGCHIYIDDGNIALLVRGRQGQRLKTSVVTPGPLKESKGVNIPEVNLRFKGVTPKDRADLLFGIHHRVDYVAQSFVRDKNDILPIREIIKAHRANCQIIAKIENHQGIKNIDEIIEVSDGIMIARGDMGVCIPIFKIPAVQKEIIKKCNWAKKPVITATQMLESMTEHPRPTRAEVTDVANAVLDGTNYVMLSAETASGQYPAESVETMKQIIRFTEQYHDSIQADWKTLWS